MKCFYGVLSFLVSYTLGEKHSKITSKVGTETWLNESV